MSEAVVTWNKIDQLGDSLATVESNLSAKGVGVRELRFKHVNGHDVVIPLKLPVSNDTGNDLSLDAGANLYGSGDGELDIREYNDVSIASGQQLVAMPGINVLNCKGDVSIDGDGIIGVAGKPLNFQNRHLYQKGSLKNLRRNVSNSQNSSSKLVILADTIDLKANTTINLSSDDRTAHNLESFTTEIGPSSTSLNTSNIKRCAFDGTYLHIGTANNYLVAYLVKPDGSLEYKAELNVGASIKAVVWDEGRGVLHVPAHTSGGRAYSFDGSTYSSKGTCSFGGMNSADVTFDDNYVYYCGEGSNGGIYAFPHDGTSYGSEAGFQADGSAGFLSIYHHDGTLFVAAGTDGIRAFTFNGSSFTQTATRDDGGNYQGVAANDEYIWFSSTSSSSRKYTYNGSSFTSINSFASFDNVWIDTTGSEDVIYWLSSSNNLTVQKTDNTSLGTITPPSGTFRTIAVLGEYLFVSAQNTDGDRVWIYSKGGQGIGGEVYLLAKTRLTLRTGSVIKCNGGGRGYAGRIVLRAPIIDGDGAGGAVAGTREATGASTLMGAPVVDLQVGDLFNG